MLWNSVVRTHDKTTGSAGNRRPWRVGQRPTWQDAAVMAQTRSAVSQATDLLEAHVPTVAHDDVIENLDAEQDAGGGQP